MGTYSAIMVDYVNTQKCEKDQVYLDFFQLAKVSVRSNVQLDGAHVHIEQVSTYMFLGVMVNQSLSWNGHIDLVSSRASKGLSPLRRIAWFLPRHVFCASSTRAILYHTWRMRVLSGDPAHGQRVTGLSACRTMLLTSSLVGIEDASATAMRRELGWPTLPSRWALAESQMVRRCVTGCAPQYLASFFVQSTRVHLHNIHSQQQPCSQRHTCPQGQVWIWEDVLCFTVVLTVECLATFPEIY